MYRCSIIAVSTVKSGATEAKKDYEKAKRKYQVLLKKQETLLRGVYAL